MCLNPRCRFTILQEDSRGNQVICCYGYDLSGCEILLRRNADAFKKGCIAFSNHINNTKFDIDTYIDYEYIDVSGN